MLTLPSREVLADIVDRLKDKRVTEATLTSYASDLFDACSAHSRQDANVAIHFMLYGPMTTVDELLGEQSPGVSELVMIRHALDKLAGALDAGHVELDSVKVRILRELLSPVDDSKAAAASAVPLGTSKPGLQLPPLSSGANPKLADPPTGGGRRSQDPLARTASLDALSIGAKALEQRSFDPLDPAEEKKNELFPYLFASVALAVTVFLILQMTEVHWPLWLKLTVCASAPVAVMGFWAATRKYKFLKWVRALVFWGAASLLLIVVGRYGLYLYKQMAIQRDYQAALDRVQVVASTILSYERRTGAYPLNLARLSEEGDLKLRFSDHTKYFIDPFSPTGDYLQYDRFVDGFIVSSIGPHGVAPNLSWPSVRDEQWEEALANATYDPTNGLDSPGAIIYVSKQRQKE